jgi:hypothetical protein
MVSSRSKTGMAASSPVKGMDVQPGLSVLCFAGKEEAFLLTDI